MSSTTDVAYNRDLAVASLKHFLSGWVNRTGYGTWHSARPTSTVIRYWDRGEFRYQDYVGYRMDGIHKLFDRSDRSQGMRSTIDPRAIRYQSAHGYRLYDAWEYLPDTIETRYARWYVMHVEQFFDVRKMDEDLVALLCRIDDENNKYGFIDDVLFGVLSDYLEERDII